MDRSPQVLGFLVALVLSPFSFSVIRKVKAFFGGRQGPPLLQPWFDILKLLKKGTVYSRTTTQVFRIAPAASLAGSLTALLLVPVGKTGALVAFDGDLILLVYLFGMMRFVTVLAALDTGSAFEGMGASREVQFSVVSEVALLVAMASLAAMTQKTSLSEIMAALAGAPENGSGVPARLLVAASLFVVFIAENTRVPVDDPETHLELTMIHEAMVLDHGGPDLAMIQYAAGLKFWAMAAVLVGAIMPVHTAHPLVDLLVLILAVLGVAVLVGIVESSMARLRLVRVPQLLVAAGVLSLLALVLVSR